MSNKVLVEKLLDHALHGQHVEIRKILEHPRYIEDGSVHADVTDRNDSTPLILCIKGATSGYAAFYEYRQSIQALAQYDADVDLCDSSGRTALHWAVEKHCVPLIEELLKVGADPTIEDFDGLTPIYYAIQNDFNDVLPSFIKLGPQKVINARSSDGSTPLSFAVTRGYADACQILLILGADPNTQDVDANKFTVLHHAVHKQYFDILKILLRHVARPEITNGHLNNVLHDAAVTSDPRYLSTLCELEIDEMAVNKQNADGVTPLMLACQHDATNKVQSLLRKKAQVSLLDHTGKTALHYCAENKESKSAELVLQADPSLLEMKDQDGYSVLQLAVIAGNDFMVEWLLGQKADIRTRDNEEHTAAHWATVCGHISLIDVLHSHNAEMSLADIHRAFPIHYAAQMCGGSAEQGADPALGLEMLRKLLDVGVPIDVVDQDGRPPLLWAASSGSVEACEELLRFGAKVEASDKDGLTALHCAASRGYENCVETLLQNGAHIDSQDKNGCTPLFYAITLGHLDTARMLLNHGAGPSHQDKKGRTPAHCGAAKGAKDALKLLKANKADLWMKNSKGEYPVHEAALAKQTMTVDYLLDQTDKDMVNITNKDGRTCLHIAALTNNLPLCELLVRRGANPRSLMEGRVPSAAAHQKTVDKQLTPYDAAVLKRNEEVAEFLKQFLTQPSKESEAAESETDGEEAYDADAAVLEHSQEAKDDEKDEEDGVVPRDVKEDAQEQSNVDEVDNKETEEQSSEPNNAEKVTDDQSATEGEQTVDDNDKSVTEGATEQQTEINVNTEAAQAAAVGAGPPISESQATAVSEEAANQQNEIAASAEAAASTDVGAGPAKGVMVADGAVKNQGLEESAGEPEDKKLSTPSDSVMPPVAANAEGGPQTKVATSPQAAAVIAAGLSSTSENSMKASESQGTQELAPQESQPVSDKPRDIETSAPPTSRPDVQQNEIVSSTQAATVAAVTATSARSEKGVESVENQDVQQSSAQVMPSSAADETGDGNNTALVPKGASTLDAAPAVDGATAAAASESDATRSEQQRPISEEQQGNMERSGATGEIAVAAGVVGSTATPNNINPSAEASSVSQEHGGQPNPSRSSAEATDNVPAVEPTVTAAPAVAGNVSLPDQSGPSQTEEHNPELGTSQPSKTEGIGNTIEQPASAQHVPTEHNSQTPGATPREGQEMVTSPRDEQQSSNQVSNMSQQPGEPKTVVSLDGAIPSSVAATAVVGPDGKGTEVSPVADGGAVQSPQNTPSKEIQGDTDGDIKQNEMSQNNAEGVPHVSAVNEAEIKGKDTKQAKGKSTKKGKGKKGGKAKKAIPAVAVGLYGGDEPKKPKENKGKEGKEKGKGKVDGKTKADSKGKKGDAKTKPKLKIADKKVLAEDGIEAPEGAVLAAAAAATPAPDSDDEIDQSEEEYGSSDEELSPEVVVPESQAPLLTKASQDSSADPQTEEQRQQALAFNDDSMAVANAAAGHAPLASDSQTSSQTGPVPVHEQQLTIQNAPIDESSPREATHSSLSNPQAEQKHKIDVGENALAAGPVAAANQPTAPTDNTHASHQTVPDPSHKGVISRQEIAEAQIESQVGFSPRASNDSSQPSQDAQHQAIPVHGSADTDSQAVSGSTQPSHDPQSQPLSQSTTDSNHVSGHEEGPDGQLSSAGGVVTPIAVRETPDSKSSHKQKNSELENESVHPEDDLSDADNGNIIAPHNQRGGTGIITVPDSVDGVPATGMSKVPTTSTTSSIEDGGVLGQAVQNSDDIVSPRVAGHQNMGDAGKSPMTSKDDGVRHSPGVPMTPKDGGVRHPPGVPMTPKDGGVRHPPGVPMTPKDDGVRHSPGVPMTPKDDGVRHSPGVPMTPKDDGVRHSPGVPMTPKDDGVRHPPGVAGNDTCRTPTAIFGTVLSEGDSGKPSTAPSEKSEDEDDDDQEGGHDLSNREDKYNGNIEQQARKQRKPGVRRHPRSPGSPRSDEDEHTDTGYDSEANDKSDESKRDKVALAMLPTSGHRDALPKQKRVKANTKTGEDNLDGPSSKEDAGTMGEATIVPESENTENAKSKKQKGQKGKSDNKDKSKKKQQPKVPNPFEEPQIVWAKPPPVQRSKTAISPSRKRKEKKSVGGKTGPSRWADFVDPPTRNRSKSHDKQPQFGRPQTVSTENPYGELAPPPRLTVPIAEERPKTSGDAGEQRRSSRDVSRNTSVLPLRRTKKREKPKPTHRPFKNEIQELVRIFDCKTLALSEINKSKKLTLYNTYRGGLKEKTLVKHLQKDYNTKARERLGTKVKSTKDWEDYLQDVLYQAEADEKAIKTGWKEEAARKGESGDFDLRFNAGSQTTLSSQQSSTRLGSKSSSPYVKDDDKTQKDTKSLALPKLDPAGGKSKTKQKPQTYSAAAPPSRRTQSQGNPSSQQNGLVDQPPMRRSKTMVPIEASSPRVRRDVHSTTPTKWTKWTAVTPRFDGGTRQRHRLVFVEPDEYRKKLRAQRESQRRKQQEEMKMLLKSC